MRTLLHDPAYVVDRPGPFDLARFPTDVSGEEDKKELKARVDKDKERIIELQERLYATDSHALLLVFQAMDASGKDSCIRHVLSGLDPQGSQVWSFKAPSAEERDHDFLWRHARALPERGRIGIHNRSHYEEVVVTRVHPEFVLAQRIPGIDRADRVGKAFWQRRYSSILHFEEHLAQEGTVIMKFFLHMGRDAQKQRFLERIHDPEKRWKFNAEDVRERAHWKAYQQAYSEAIGATAAAHAPWYIVPADEQWESRALVARIIRERLEAMDLRPLKPSAEQDAAAAEAERILNMEPKDA
ncbi:MAG: polyphosphate kinase 2 family protein [Flavobacteriales bacterium]|nr:polyphosphate kinase 2 family protein [Flavobacteriales bacterium]MBP6697009.1 polyphosphate kinase 2 family protein [Flavobacteriales bacterium]